MGSVKLVLFDLDDTLYPEMDYVRSGFRHVSECLFQSQEAREAAYHRMVELFSVDKGHVFDKLASELCAMKLGPFRTREGIAPCDSDVLPSASAVASWMIDEYRSHSPDIRLDEDGLNVLRTLRARGIKTGLVTDGLAAVQKRKVAALGLEHYLDCIIYTDELAPNREYWKPSSKPFELALALFSLEPKDACYIGDNPSKDFQGPTSLGMYTVWFRRESGVYSCSVPLVTPSFEIRELKELLRLPILNLG